MLVAALVTGILATACVVAAVKVVRHHKFDMEGYD